MYTTRILTKREKGAFQNCKWTERTVLSVLSLANRGTVKNKKAHVSHRSWIFHAVWRIDGVGCCVMAKERASAATVFSQCNISFRKSTQRQLPSHTTKLSGWGELTCQLETKMLEIHKTILVKTGQAITKWWITNGMCFSPQYTIFIFSVWTGSSMQLRLMRGVVSNANIINFFVFPGMN